MHLIILYCLILKWILAWAYPRTDPVLWILWNSVSDSTRKRYSISYFPFKLVFVCLLACLFVLLLRYLSSEWHNQILIIHLCLKVKKGQRAGTASQGIEIQPEFIKKNTFLMCNFKCNPCQRTGEPWKHSKIRGGTSENSYQRRLIELLFFSITVEWTDPRYEPFCKVAQS